MEGRDFEDCVIRWI